MADNLLGAYLRARRGRLRPVDVGLSQRGTRRVPGLRREEVALLAGISVDYYLRLEQGRGCQPSEQVLRSLARVLQLDEAATDYLLDLIAPQPAAPAPEPGGEQVPSSVLNLLDVIGLPAFVTGQKFDVLAANPAARVISPELAPGRNRLRSLFLADTERALYRDWNATTQRFVAVVRDVVGRNATDPDFVGLIEELITRSARFRELWARHDVSARDTEISTFHHPIAGDLQLHLERLDITGVAGQSLVVYHPAAGSHDAARLAALLHRSGESSQTAPVMPGAP